MIYNNSFYISSSYDLLDKDLIESWIEESPKKHYEKGELIIRPQTDKDYIYLIVEGEANIFHLHEDGKECIIGLLSKGDLIHLFDIFIDDGINLISKALDDLTIAKIPKEKIRNKVINNPDLSMKFLREFSNKMNYMAEILSQVAYGKVEERLVYLLRDLANKEQESQGYNPIEISLTHQDMASMIGSTRETVTLLLSKLNSRGIIVEKDFKQWIKK